MPRLLASCALALVVLAGPSAAQPVDLPFEVKEYPPDAPFLNEPGGDSDAFRPPADQSNTPVTPDAPDAPAVAAPPLPTEPGANEGDGFRQDGLRQRVDENQSPPERAGSSIGDAIGPLLAPTSRDPASQEPDPLQRLLEREPAGPAPPVPGDGFARPQFPPPDAAPHATGTEGLIASPSVEIDWRVENPFRFFVDPRDSEVHRATYLALAPEQRQSAPVLAAEHALARRHEAGWAETMYRKTCWLASKNRYDCPGDEDYVNPRHHKVVVSLKNMLEPDLHCRWSSSMLGSRNTAETAVTQPCGAPLKLTVPYPEGLSVRVEVGGREVAATEIKVTDIFVVGIGDSFGSGEGNPDVPVRFSPERTMSYGQSEGEGELAGYPARVGPWKQVGDKAFVDANARWLDQACHRSLYSYQLRAALQLAVEDPHRAVTYAGFACSGAEVTWGLFLRYKGNEWVPTPPDLSQISAVADVQCGKRDPQKLDMPEAYHMNGVIPELMGGLVLAKCPVEHSRKIDLLLMSAGGNDIGFARLVANAVLSDESLVRSLGGWFGQVHGNQESQELLKRLDQRYKAINRALHGILHLPWEESDRIVLTGYPPFALLDDAGQMCRDGTDGMEVFSDFKITQKAALSSAWLADKLDGVMKASAKAHGWTFVDAHRQTFVGRGLCAGHTNGRGPLVDDLRLPRRIGNKWVPFNPAHYEPYAARQRWFRTPNDAFLTGNFHVAGSVMQKVLKLQSFSRFQVLLAATYSGAFHPTAEGHAAMADAAVEQARAVLARHGQQSAAAAAAMTTETP